MSAIISTCLEINYDCVPDFTQIDDPDLHTPTLDDSIEYHVQWLGKHHFCLPTRKHIKNHGLLHSARVACFIPMLDRLWRQLDPSTPALSERKMLLLQLAGAFHDIARQADGEDLWDNESATALLHYLHEVLGVELAEAIEIAEVVANKDPHSDGYYKFEIPTDDTGAWVKDVDGQCAPVKLTTHHESERGYLHQLLQTVDSLEIHRCSKTFDMRYTDLFNQFSHLPIEYFAEIRTQYAAWLSQHGDLSPMKSQDQRARFSAPDTCMTKLVEGTQLDELPLIKALHTGTGIITALVRELSEDKWQQRLNKGTLSVRGLPVPKNRSAAEVIASELATSTETPNKYRSTSDISLDRGVYCSAGVVISEPTATEIIASSGQNLASGNGDKTAYLFQIGRAHV